MTKKKWTFIFILALVVGIGLIWLFSKSRKPVEPEKRIIEEVPSKLQKETKPVVKQESGIDMEKPDDMSPELWKRVLAHYERHVGENGTIEFYGRIIDQDESPVPDVEIIITLRCNKESLSALMKSDKEYVEEKLQLFTDMNGEFSVINKYGSKLIMNDFLKEGYLKGRIGDYHFGEKVRYRHHPDPDNPVIFHMWRELAETEALIEGKSSCKLVMNGGKKYLNLITGKEADGISSHGDLIISAFIDSKDEQNNYGWSIKIEVINGGLIETKDTFLYLAPESGYKPALEYSFSKKVSREEGIVDRKYYLTSRNAQLYAALTLTVITSPIGEASVYIYHTINPNGSRNLQYDKKKRIAMPSELRKIDKKLRNLK